MIPKDVRDHLKDDVGDDPVYILAHLICMQKHAIDLYAAKFNPDYTQELRFTDEQIKTINGVLVEIRNAYAKNGPYLPYLSHEFKADKTVKLGMIAKYVHLLDAATKVISDE